MGNLVRNTNRLLINSDKDQFVADTTNNKLFIKDYAGSIEANNASYAGQAKTVLKAGKKTPVPSIVVLETEPMVASQPISFSNGINIRKQAKFKGFQDEIPEVAKYYDGYIEHCAPINGATLADSDLVKLRESIKSLINGDVHGFGYAGIPLIFDVGDVATATTATIIIGSTEKTYTGADTTAFAKAVNDAGLAYAVVSEESGLVIITGLKGEDITEAGTPGYVNLSLNASYTRPLYVIAREETRRLMITPDNVGPVIHTQAGDYGYLTSLDMYRLFSIKPYDFFSRPKVPIEDVDYVKYRFEIVHEGYALDGFGHEDKVREKMEIYLADTGTQVFDFETKLDAIGLAPIGDSFVI